MSGEKEVVAALVGFWREEDWQQGKHCSAKLQSLGCSEEVGDIFLNIFHFQKIIFWKSMRSLFPENDLLKMTTPRISIFFILRRKLNWLPETTGCL